MEERRLGERNEQEFYLMCVLWGGGGLEGTCARSQTQGDVERTGQAPPPRISSNDTLTEGLGHEAPSYHRAVMCKIIECLFSLFAEP